jgi:S1-C subfamily serine protease
MKPLLRIQRHLALLWHIRFCASLRDLCSNESLALRCHRVAQKFFAIAVVVVLLASATDTIAQANTASSLFERGKQAVYQIRVIDVASGDKYSIGSGFQISYDGLIGTNFHVVSAFVHEPAKFRLEYVRHDGEVHPVTLLLTDVVHDLALLKTENPSEAYLELATQELGKGDRIYSMGNPLDLGMSIIEGTYNGLVENSRYRKILFSGSLNAGMSGGPALDSAGKVMGINVSKGEEQLSFLVPVDHLRALLAEHTGGTAVTDHDERIRQALIADQDAFYQSMVSQPPKLKTMGALSIPDRLVESLRCWGHSVDEEEKDKKYTAAHQHCRAEDNIFVTQKLYIGHFQYDFELINTDQLNRFQFYSLLQEQFSHQAFGNTDDKEQVGKFTCEDDLVRINDHKWKVSTCMRAYKKYTGLFDASMIMVSMDFADRAAIVTVSASGISAENAGAVFRYIAEAVTWKQ